VGSAAATLGRSVVGAASHARRWTSTRWFLLLAWGLTFHILAVMWLFAASGLPMEAVRAAAAWKEVVVLVLVMGAVVRLATGRAPDLTPRATDLLAGGLVALAGLHALASLAGWGPTATALDLVYGMRDLVFGFLLYFVGRTTPGIAESRSILGHLFLIGVITSGIAVLERLFVTPEGLVALGVASYFNDFLGVSVMTAGNGFGLPNNYWTEVGGRYMQRAGSVYLSSQGFAISFLVIVPAAATWLMLTRRWRSPLYALGFAILGAGLLLSVTRMTITACVLQLLLLLVLWRKPGTVLALAAAGTIAAAALLVTVPGLAHFVWETLTWQSGSSGSHSKDYYNGLIALLDYPLGAGLGTTDLTAARLGRPALTNDNLFLKYGVELGVPGLLLFVGWLASLLWTGVRSAAVAVRRQHRAFFAFAAACTLGVIVNGATAVVFNLPMITYLFFWIVGVAVSILDRDEVAHV
jgi:hypothetical protein